MDGIAFQAAEHLAEGARERTPIDTGLLHRSWQAVETGALTAKAKNEVHYASFVEFDTRHWISRNIVPGQRFMHRAMVETEDKLKVLVKERVEEIIRGSFNGK